MPQINDLNWNFYFRIHHHECFCSKKKKHNAQIRDFQHRKSCCGKNSNIRSLFQYKGREEYMYVLGLGFLGLGLPSKFWNIQKLGLPRSLFFFKKLNYFDKIFVEHEL